LKAENLSVSSRLQLSGVAQLIPGATDNCTVSIVEPQRVISIRHLPDRENALQNVLADANVRQVPAAGHFEGEDPFLLWLTPTEYLLITSSDAFADDFLAALPTAQNALAYALDLSAGYLVVELQGEGIQDVLPRLLDASAIPQTPGRCTRARVVETAAIMLRFTDNRVWLVTDRVNDRYLMRWIAYAMQATVTQT
jgi:sarcosine oxidase gamma subunit